MFEDIQSDDDEEIIEYERRPYTVRERTNYIDTLDDLDFKMRFRLKKETILMILQQIEAQIETPTDRNFSVSPINQLLLALRFYATGSFLICAGDYFNVSKSTACKIVNKVTDAIASLSPQFIRMPSTEDEITTNHLDFYSIARLPRTIGSIDCTHIKIQSPGGNNAEVFRNRKGYFSINVQTVSSAKMNIIDIVARWPGSAHDQVVFENSAVYQRLHANEFGNSLLVGDSGYTDTSHVITPIDQANNEVEQLYSEAVRRTRNPVERLYGVWKRRFPILSLGLRLQLNNSLAVIVACGVLHNIALQQNEQLPPEDPEIRNVNFDEEFEMEPLPQVAMNTAKDQLLVEYFPNLLNPHR